MPPGFSSSPFPQTQPNATSNTAFGGQQPLQSPLQNAPSFGQPQTTPPLSPNLPTKPGPSSQAAAASNPFTPQQPQHSPSFAAFLGSSGPAASPSSLFTPQQPQQAFGAQHFAQSSAFPNHFTVAQTPADQAAAPSAPAEGGNTSFGGFGSLAKTAASPFGTGFGRSAPAASPFGAGAAGNSSAAGLFGSGPAQPGSGGYGQSVPAPAGAFGAGEAAECVFDIINFQFWGFFFFGHPKPWALTCMVSGSCCYVLS